MTEASMTPRVPESCPSNSADVGHAEVCQSCPGRQLCQSQTEPDQMMQASIELRMRAIGHKILVVSGKGGVGKSSFAAFLASSLAQHHERKTAILDTDICGPSIAKLMRVEGQEVVTTQYGWKPPCSPFGNVKVMTVASLIETNQNSIIFRGPRKTQLIRRLLSDTFWGKLDYLVIDTPPGTSDEHLSVIKCLEKTIPDGAVIVTTPQKVSLATIRREIQFCRTMKIKILGLVENMAGFTCPCCKEVWDIFSRGDAETLCKEYRIPFLGSVPLDQTFAHNAEQGFLLGINSSPASKYMRVITENIVQTVEQGLDSR